MPGLRNGVPCAIRAHPGGVALAAGGGFFLIRGGVIFRLSFHEFPEAMKPRILIIAAACATLCVLAACPAQAQTALQKANDATLEAFEAAAKVSDAEADAYEASMFAKIAWASVGNVDADANTGLSEDISSARETASGWRETASGWRGNASDWRELASRARESASSAREMALSNRRVVAEIEGNMMVAQANATGRYAALWERAAEAAGASRTAWVRAVSLRDAEARAWDAAAKAWEAVGK